jgi:hypothetical protein
MPVKSKRNRRKISQSRKTSTLLDTVPKNIEPNINGLPIKNAVPFGVKPSTATDLNSLKYLFDEIKWIGVVTGIIIVLLIISYIVFR